MRKIPLKKLIFALLVAVILLAGAPPVSAAETADPEPVLLESDRSAEFSVSTTADGWYRVELMYKAVPGKTVNPQLTVSLSQEKILFSRSITLPRVWEDLREGDRFETDDAGNELVPRQREIDEKQTVQLSLTGGDIPVFLEAGSYRLSLTMTSCSVWLYAAGLVEDNSRSYEEYMVENAGNPASGEQPLTLEAELPSRKSSAGIIATYDNSTPDISPSFADRISLGLIQAGYQEGQWLEWNFHTDKAGWYKIVFSYRQNSMRGLGVRRRFSLDGEHLYNELDEVVFPYTEDFTELCPSVDEKPYLIYLSEGEHVLRIMVTTGSLYVPLQQLDEAVSRMNKVYRNILAITGATPDLYRDYYLEKEIPDLIDDLTYCRETLNTAARKIEELSDGRSGSETAVFDEAIRVIDEMIEKPFRIPTQFDNYKSQIDAVANQSVYLKQQPLDLDTIEFLPDSGESARIRYGFFQKLWYRLQRFFYSFFETKTEIQSELVPLKVWMSVSQLQVTGTAAGREQMQVLQRLCAEQFDYPVEMSLVNTDEVITQAILSGKGPDVVLFVPEQTTINLAVRGALADFTEMPNIEEIKDRFHPSALVASDWDGGLYGLPETQTWFMMFCRTDILEASDLEVPETWDELYYALQVLRQQNMMIGIPQDQRVYEMLLMQQGGAIYNEELTATCMTEEASVGAFTAWTDFFVKHSTPLSYDFYNRFRTGEMPIGIADYTLYNQLMVAAPELIGSWEMLPVPGCLSESGIDRRQSCTINNCIVVESSSLKEQAFAFADWWTSADTQQRFGMESEISLGISARYNTANLEAAAGLNWTDRELRNLEKARGDLWDVEQTPASYYYNRNILNAFRRVVYNYESPRDVIERYAEEIDREIERKNEQF